MAEFRALTPRYSVSTQLAAADLKAAADAGFVLVVNNRPDHEGPGQPAGEAMEAAASAAGLAYVHIPIAGRPTPDQIATHRRVVEGAGGPVLAFCRSGTRSAIVWALGRPEPRGTLIALAARAGYDLRPVLPP